MSQLTIYLDEKTLRRVTEAARRERKSVSAWAREHLAACAVSQKDWKARVAESFGSIADSTFEAPPSPDGPLRDVDL